MIIINAVTKVIIVSVTIMKMKVAPVVGGTDLLSESLRLSEGVPETMKKGKINLEWQFCKICYSF